MSNYTISVAMSEHLIRCEADGRMICLGDLAVVGNRYRKESGQRVKNLADIRLTQGYKDFRRALSIKTKISESSLECVSRGRKGKTMGHYALGIYIAEQLSPEFHVELITEFMDRRVLEMKDDAGMEYKQLSVDLDDALNKWDEVWCSKGHCMILANILAENILPEGVTWSTANPAQIRARFNAEQALATMIRLDLIKSWKHFKEVAGKV